MKGKSSFNNSSSVPQSMWVLDSGATDHSIPTHFTTYIRASDKQLITVAYGDHVPIVGLGNIQLQSSLSLHNILHVPKLANNLISRHRLTQDLNCSVIFFHSHCIFQNLASRKTILIAKEQDELYFLQHEIDDNIRRKKMRCLSDTKQHQKLGLLHKFGFITRVLGILHLVYLNLYYHICL
uniref:Retrovirus-related Pol polyprotein from transposon TNT 1-94-like beta-barrel domain-containing protein n=1 Tax=Cajanus cajan TaxID=3821 RepID=A0A151TWT1_CAJCA|nr:hypothetical protein KK1_010802 [Cajanus cajan]